MSAAISTLPARLKNEILPSAERDAVTPFGVGACPAVQFKLDANGNGLSAGNTVKNDDAVGPIAITFIDNPVAPTGIVHLPFVPHAVAVNVAP